MVCLNQFIFFGLFGLTLEVIFTSIRNKDVSLVGHTSVWMFPIYSFGLTYGFDLICYLIKNDVARFISYPFWIWSVEILFGYFFKKLNIVAWDYSYLPNHLHWKGVVSFAHFPIWIFFGILVEFIKKNYLF